ncbi:polysaccharide deacetylase family protein, partial [Enterococcus mundtii]|uniref:hypothetical protein n=1 Tax=Enterococcus mundtii TaxID=53346 RepID=UPI0039710DFF
MNRKLTAGVITGLLLAPTAIANAQENDAQSRVTTHTEQVAYTNEVAAATTREQLIAQFGKLSENSSADDMVIAKGDLQVLSAAGFNEHEVAFIEAKYRYLEEQRSLLSELQKLGKEMTGISFTSKTFIADVAAFDKKYDNFLKIGTDNLKAYVTVQKEFEAAVTAALNNAK